MKGKEIDRLRHLDRETQIVWLRLEIYGLTDARYGAINDKTNGKADRHGNDRWV